MLVPPPEYDPQTHGAITDFVEVGPGGVVTSWSSPGCGARSAVPGSGSAVSIVSRPITWRSSAIAARPPASTASSASRA